MSLWQISTIALYLLGAVMVMRLIYVADLDMEPKASGYEKVFCFVVWPLLAVGCLIILAINWLRDRS